MPHPNPLSSRPARLLWWSLLCLLANIVAAPVSPARAYSGVVSWAAVSSSPIARTESQGAAVDGKVYIFGGFYNTSYQATTRSDVYDPATNRWARIADMPLALTHSAKAVDGELIYLVGGYVGNHPGPSTTRVLAYNTRTNTWGEAPPLPEARGAGTAAIVGRKLHFIGGALRSGASFTEVDKVDHFVLNLDGGAAWERAAELTLGRNHLGSTTLDGKIYVVGGQFAHNEGTTSHSRVDIYDPVTDRWSRAADLPVGRSHIESSVLAVDGRVLVIGGSTDDGNYGTASSAVYAYDPQTNVWMQLTSLPGGRKSPVAASIGPYLYVLTGGTGNPSAVGWTATLPDRWESQASAPIGLGEVAAGIIDNKLYMVGEGNGATLVYNLGTNAWSSAAASRPFPGHHHAAEVIGDKLYLFGGLGNGAGKVQIYNPATNTWSLGHDMPFAAGSSSSALIGGKVYVAGGIVGSSTTTRAAVYDPVANTWSDLAPMPQGRNHAASGSDGKRLYVFGGRGPGSGDGNTVANGFDTVQIYDPATNAWISSLSPGSALAPLPVGRGGMGKAVYADGKFYVIGGETASGAGATANKVYNRVDVYTVATNSWGELATMPTARHGIFPLLIGGRIYVAGGGTQAGFSQSRTLEVLNLPAAGSDPIPIATLTPTRAPTSSPTAAPTGAATATLTGAASATPTPTSAAPGSGQVVARINAGGPALTASGQGWAADQRFAGGASSTSNLSTAIAGTDDDALYLTRRLSSASLGSFSYAIPVPAAGSYRVRLHFAENYWGVSGGGAAGAGRRVFSVNLEGGPAELANLDLNAEVAPLTAVVKELTVSVTDGALDILFTASVDRPLVNAIEVLPAMVAEPTATPTPTAPPTFTPTPTSTATSTATSTPTSAAASPEAVARINAGGSGLTVNGLSWASDRHFTGGSAGANSAVTAIAGTDNDALYLTRRVSSSGLNSFSYAIPVPAAGSYRVRLHFAETYWGATGGGAGGVGRRVFSVNLEGGPAELASLDLNAEAPPMTAVVKELTVSVTDGALDILFTASVDRPLVSAIEVLPATAGSSAEPSGNPGGRGATRWIPAAGGGARQAGLLGGARAGDPIGSRGG